MLGRIQPGGAVDITDLLGPSGQMTLSFVLRVCRINANCDYAEDRNDYDDATGRVVIVVVAVE